MLIGMINDYTLNIDEQEDNTQQAKQKRIKVAIKDKWNRYTES
jgi:hypothetical protein